MLDMLAWFKHRIDAIAVPWFVFTILSFATIPARDMSAVFFIVAWVYFLPVPLFVQLYRIYYWCARYYNLRNAVSG